MELLTVKVDSLRPHPENYNEHPDEQLAELEKSLDQFAQFKNIVITPEHVILAGHGLVEAAKRKGIKTLDAYVFDGTHEQEKALLLSDNATPFLALPNTDKLNALLESLPSLDNIPGITRNWLADMNLPINQEKQEEKYSKNIIPPIYEITGENPGIEELVNTEKSQYLIEKIQQAEIPLKIKTFLIQAAYRHDIFNFGKIAEFYAHANKEIQFLFEESALVIIDFNKAIEQGLVELSEQIIRQYQKEYEDDED